jgi:DNA modification methylase
MTQNNETNVENYEFEPIKGYPMLNWKGKRPFRSTQYFPAQLKEVYGQEDESGWINKIFWGDNLQVMSHLLKDFRGKVDLIYIDPPFDSKADYKKSIKLKGNNITNDSNSFEEKQYTDIWSNDDYLQFMYERILLIKELLSEKGSLFLHCDHRKNHHLRCILDEVFGEQNFRSTITREKCNTKNYTSSAYGNISDTVLFYSKSEDYIWNTVYVKMTQSELEASFDKIDSNGRRYKTAPLHASGTRSGQTGDSWRGLMPPPGNHWRYIHKTLDELDENKLIEWSSTGNPRKFIYADESKGIPLQDIWLKIKDGSGEYPTQKNEVLLQRIIESASNKHSLVFDCFMGSGTTQFVANKLGRRFIGADINLGAIQVTTKRLANSVANFEVYNVNNYDIFRNPVEAKDLLLEALEIQPLSLNTVYDGEKDGYKVKIMPVNRIATKEDLNDLITNMPYKMFEARKNAEPNKAVEEVMLVCMGHEPSLGAELENEVLANGYKIKVNVVDILRDKSDLTFKYDSEAAIKIEDGKLIVETFYPRNLLQKLSQQKNDLTEWREMVESIMIDWNFDGAVMEPIVIDIPSKDEFVSGEYEIPESASNIKVKITDLLSESYEEVIIYT